MGLPLASGVERRRRQEIGHFIQAGALIMRAV
jgi:hypothetical protein